MMLWLALLFFVAGLVCLSIDRRVAHYCRERLAKPAFQFALKVTDWAKGGPWIGAAALIYLAAQAWIAIAEVTPLVRAVSDYALALLASFIVGSVILHVIKIFLGRRRPRDDFEHGLYGFRYFTWQLQYDSFPSGHSMTIFSVAVVLSAAFPLLAPLWLVLALGLSLTRAMLTAHFLADVMVGAAIGIIATRQTFLLLFPDLSPSWL
jgi:membrane-associated phospholipid phosphatase